MQKTTFLTGGEGDAYFDRNEKQFDGARDPVVATLARISSDYRSVLEIGCGHGGRVAALVASSDASGCGIDPSSKAIEYALTHYSGIDYKVGTADNLPFQDSQFDLVIFGFCLYLCDIEDHFTIVNEANRVLRDGGLLVIYDFAAVSPFKNAYRHKKGVHSYKMTWSNMFTSHPSYTLLAREYAERNGNRSFHFDEILVVDVLRKDLGAAFPVRA